MAPLHSLFLLLTTLTAASRAAMFLNQTLVNYNPRALYNLTDPVVILSNISNTESDIWQTNILVLTNNGDDGGLPGILYDRGLACDTDYHPVADSLLSPPSNLNRNIPLIALISRGGCNFDLKLQTAVWDGASMAIIYDTSPINDSSSYTWSFSGNDVLPLSALENETAILTNPKLDSVFVDARIGQTLYQLLNSTRMASDVGTGYDDDEYYRNSFNRQPPQIPKLSGPPNNPAMALYVRMQFWDTALDSNPFKAFNPLVNTLPQQGLTEPEKDAAISVPILFLFCLGLGVFFFIRRRNMSRRADRRMAATLRWRPASSHFESPSETPKEYPLVDQSRKSAEQRSSQVVSSRAAIVPETVIGKLPTRAFHKTIRPDASTPLGGIMAQLSDGTISQQWNMDQSDPTCIMCAERLSEGDMVTTLGCGHEGHKGCVSRYLTNTSSLCPVCTFDVLAARKQFNPFVVDDDEELRGVEVHAP